jgi:5'-nucleotidase
MKPDPVTGEELYWLTGYYHNEEEEAEGTDETVLSKGYISVVPTHFDFTAYNVIEKIKRFEKL